MRTTSLLRIFFVGCILSSFAHSADARPLYYKWFSRAYSAGNDKDIRRNRCLVCHLGKTKRNRNAFGKALGQALGKKNVKEPPVFFAALKKAEAKKSPVDGKTYGEILKKDFRRITVLDKEIEARRRAEAAVLAARNAATAKRVTEAVTKLTSSYLNRRAKPFDIQSLSGEKFTADALKDRITILHFWEYHGEPLKAPYGQVGYLSYLYEQLKRKRVQLLGVAVDSRLADPKKRNAALQGIRKLKSFMMLDYPLLLDDGELLAEFGDPRQVVAKLPLFVVVNRGGQVAHYHVGPYEDNDLSKLQKAITKSLQRSKR